MKSFAILALLSALLLCGCGSSNTSKPASGGVTNVATTQTGPAWPLPGLSATMTVTRQDFIAGFAGAQLAQIQQQGLFTRSNDPSRPQHFDQGVLLSVQGESPSAHVPFSSNAFFGPLDYEPAAGSGLALPSKLNAEFVKNYCLPAKGPGTCAKIGRATGMIALLTSESIRSHERGFTRANDVDFNHAYGGAVLIRPPGYQTGKGTTQAGHQLGYELGGPVKDARNFVTQYNLANAPAQSTIENEVKDELTPPGTSLAKPNSVSVYLRVTPVYQGTCVVPYEVRYEVIGSDGWQLPRTATGIAAKWLKFERGSDGVTVAIIRNAEQSGNEWLVPGQNPATSCVPSSYAG
jgi:hypothetical protein